MIPVTGTARIAAWPGSHHLSAMYGTEADFWQTAATDAERIVDLLPPEDTVTNGELCVFMITCGYHH